MSDVAGHGRTVIFVSHNMTAVQSLCRSAVYLKQGKLIEHGPVNQVINTYLNKEIRNILERKWSENDAPGNEKVRILCARIVPEFSSRSDSINVTTPISIVFEIKNYMGPTPINLSVVVSTVSGTCIFNATTDIVEINSGNHSGELKIPGRFLNDDAYTIDLYIVKEGSMILYKMLDLLSFEVLDEARTGAWYGKWVGAVRPDFEFSFA